MDATRSLGGAPPLRRPDQGRRGAFAAELPAAPAAIHVLADLQQDLGQIEYARLLYQRLIEIEPLNVAAHNNIGVYYLRRRETSQAIEHLEKATSIDENRLEPHRNLWSLYRDYLAFEEAEQVLARVRAVAPNGVANWFTEEGPAAIVGDARRLRPRARDPFAAAGGVEAGRARAGGDVLDRADRRGRGLPRDRRRHRRAAAAATVEPAGARGDRGRRGGPWPGCRASRSIAGGPRLASVPRRPGAGLGPPAAASDHPRLPAPLGIQPGNARRSGCWARCSLLFYLVLRWLRARSEGAGVV